ncbi:MAG: OsmC family protein [Sedimenticola sp.]
MSKEGQFTIEMEQLEGYRFNVAFDLDGVDNLIVDEPAPLGAGSGPNPSRLLTVAAANCLSASLLFCISKNDPPAGSVKTSAVCSIGRNDKGRMRILRIDVKLSINGELEKTVRSKRCLELFEDFCVVTASLREGFDVGVEVINDAGETLHQA